MRERERDGGVKNSWCQKKQTAEKRGNVYFFNKKRKGGDSPFVMHEISFANPFNFSFFFLEGVFVFGSVWFLNLRLLLCGWMNLECYKIKQTKRQPTTTITFNFKEG